MLPILFAWGYGLVLYLLSWKCPDPTLAGIGYVLALWQFIAAGIFAWRYSREDD